MTRSNAIALMVAVGSIIAMCPRVMAQDNATNAATARLLYDEGRSLLKARKFAEACKKLEDSNRLASATDTKFWLADCYENTGRIATAWRLFREAVDESKSQGNQKKADFARERAEALVPRLPRLTISVPPDAAVNGIEIKQNGGLVALALWEQPVPVDPGDYTITVTAPGKKAWEQSRSMGEGASTVVTIPRLEDLPTSTPAPSASVVAQVPVPPVKDRGEPGRPSTAMRAAAIGAGVLGAGGLVVGTVFGLRARSQFQEAQEKCGTEAGPCVNGSVPHDLSVDANNSATVSNVGFIVGGAGLTAGVVLWLLSGPSASAPKGTSLQIAPSVGPDHAWISVRASF